MDNKNLLLIFAGTLTGDPIDEILDLAGIISRDVNLELIRGMHEDLIDIFSGSHPDFQKNTLPYHNLRHSQMVVLATIRLFHGLHCKQIHISEDTLIKGLLAAYFHDTGMLLLVDDPAQSGAEYFADHEERSILFLKRYCSRKKLKYEIARDGATIIHYTELSSEPATFDKHSPEVELAGQVVGSADILAQMADRYYLECLPLLYSEQQAGGINEHKSAMELIEHTANFYHNVALKRLNTTFANTSEAMQTHFRERYMVDRNLYIENIERNISYLNEIIDQCGDIENLKKYLKRNPPII